MDVTLNFHFYDISHEGFQGHVLRCIVQQDNIALSTGFGFSNLHYFFFGSEC